MPFERDRTMYSNHRQHTPFPTGPFEAVAYKDILTDSLLLRLYYPTSNTRKELIANQDKWPKLFPHEQYAYGIMSVYGLKKKWIQKISTWFIPKYIIPCLWNYDPYKIEDKKWPVILFSHGWGAWRNIYSTLCLEFASHGFVVAVIEHRDSSACATFSANVELLCNPFEIDSQSISYYTDDDRKSVKSENIQWILHEPLNNYVKKYDFFNKKVQRRVAECILAVDLLQQLNNGSGKSEGAGLKDLLDLGRLTLMGHSIGGATTLMALTKDSRIKVGVCLDAWMYPIKDQSIDICKKPVVFINTEDFQTPQSIEQMNHIINAKASIDKNCNGSYDNADKEVYSLIGTSHKQQSDALFTSDWLSSLFLDHRAKQNHFVAHDLTASLALDFICKQLNLNYNNKFTHLYTEANILKGFSSQTKPKKTFLMKLVQYFDWLF